MIMLLATLVIGPLSVVAILVFAPRQTSAQASASAYAKVNKAHKKYSTNVFTRKDYNRIVEMLKSLSTYNFQEVKRRSVKYYRVSMLSLIGMWVAGTLIFRDVICSIILLLFGYLVKNVYINKNVDKIRRELLAEFSTMLSSLREEYTRLNSIPDAIMECEKGHLLESQMEEIYNICTATDGEDRLYEFYTKCQFRQLKTLASTCFLLNDAGDTVNDEGQSAFKTDIGLIKDEVDLAVRKNVMIKIKFGSLEYLPLAPLAFISVVQGFFMNNIPGTSVLYNGMLGYISRLLIILAALVGYYVITNINSETYIRSNDRLETVDNLLKKRWFNKLVVDVCPKDMKTIKTLNDKIRHCLSAKDIKYIYGEKILISSICFVMALIASLIMVSTAKSFTYNNTKSLSLVGGTAYSTEEYERLFEYDCKVMARTSLETEDAMAIELKEIIPKATDFDRLEEAQRVAKKYNKYHNIYYRWWYILICYGVGVIGWNIPEFILKFRGYMVKAEAEEDVLQMQTIIASVMDTPLDTLSVIYWMEKNSTVHQDALRYCYHEYPSDPEKALERLKGKSTVAEFNHMCDKLLTTVYQISIREAFSDLLSERSHVMRIREMVQESTLVKKRTMASPLALAPIFLLAILHILLPVGILGMEEFKKAFAQAGF